MAQSTTWITNVTIVNTKDGKLQPSQTVVVQGATIVQVLRYNARTKVPDSVKQVDGTGKVPAAGTGGWAYPFFPERGFVHKARCVEPWKSVPV
jgi:hypothetical protein